ncbi:hypothetical protein ACIQNG_25490 [Streptomyces sp. NPDC091377]|uniref:hypothetical protein n=1 Tax=Streptomyces sp. NPDC091377 TaxID=3365995 RepID=UPI0037F91600
MTRPWAQSRPPAEAAAAARCTVDGCGSEATGPAPSAGMVPVTGAGDGAGAHWWCAGRCAVLARTRAELRAVPMRSGGGR